MYKSTNLTLLKISRNVLPLFFALCQCIQLQANTDKFYNSANGLSNSHINKIYQDKSGWIWIGTDNGLNTFDGNRFRTFYNIPNDTTSLLNNCVLSILEDSKNNLWIGTSAGLQRFDRSTERFENIHFSYPHTNDFSYINSIIEDHRGNIWISTNRAGAICLDAETHRPTYYMKTNSNICSNQINIIYEDRYHNIWFGSQDNGISILNTQNLIINNYTHDPLNNATISGNRIFAINEDVDGNILVGTIDHGIDRYDYATQNFTRHSIPVAGNIYTLCNDSNGDLWIGTDGQGLKHYDYTTRTLTNYESTSTGFDLKHSKIHSILEDVQGNIWVAVYQKGILRISPRHDLFHNIGFNPFNPQKNIGTDCILSICKDHKGDTWIGTDGGGIYRLNADYNVKQHYTGHTMLGNNVICLFEDSQNKIWAGTYLHGLFVYNTEKDRFDKVRLEVNNVEVKHINIITEDREGKLWIGSNEHGVIIYNSQNQETTHIQYNLMKTSNQLLGNTIQSILLSKDSIVWIGTSINGLSRFNRKNGIFTDYTAANGKLNSNNIYSIAEGKDGSLWVGTKSGLNRIDGMTGETSFYSEKNGLANSSVCGIEVDTSGNLWISTEKGLSNYNTTKKIFTNYYVSDGLIDNEFRKGAHFQSKDGELFFGGINGISYFQPFLPQSNHNLLNLVFNNLLIYNEKVQIGDAPHSILQKSVNYSEKILLNHSIKSFTIELAALEYNNPGNVTYQIKMEGFDNEWKTLPPDIHHATYTNLPAGTYCFTARANLPGTAFREKSIDIVIQPPFWLTSWAKTGYLVLAALLLFLIYYFIRKHIRKKRNEQERENETRIIQSKLQFFTDISHEIRTPLTLILTPIEHLLATTKDEKLATTYKLIDQNGKRILRLINQIMEMRRLDRGQVRLLAEETNPTEIIRTIMHSFDYLSVEKDIRFTLEADENTPKLWIDVEKFDKVIFNVLSNAFKYTPSGGEIKIKIEVADDQLKTSISDTGVGIPKDQREAIFNRFYQVADESNKNKMGTGIGLHLCRSLMEIHHGRIYVEDSPVGSTFVITLPCDGSYLAENEKTTEPTDPNITNIVQPSLLPTMTEDTETEKKSTKEYKNKYKLLIVEDEQSIRSYIAQILSENYNILEADNGNSGLQLAITEQPDCIITDLSMPGIDGLEFCKKVKSNEKTCHIPVIMLTAKTSIEQRIEGLAVGADSYIPKPFNIDHLKVRISKLIELRHLIKDKYQGKYEIDEKDLPIKTSNEKFIQKLETIVKSQLANPDLSVETISKEIGMSRSQLQRKLKQLTNQNPSEYIKTTRLRHAAWLLTTKDLSISEIAYATGFSSLSHFSNSFKDFYGMAPTQYIEINSAKDTDRT